MTIYTYMTEMQQMCRRIAFLLEKEKSKLARFYYAAATGFAMRALQITNLKHMPTINFTQIDSYWRTRTFLEKLEGAAA